MTDTKVTVKPKPHERADVVHNGKGSNADNPAEDFLHPETGEHMIPKYEAFCVNYVQYFDPEKAMVAAGYPVADVQPRTMMTAFRTCMYRKDVQARIRGLIRERAEHVGIGEDWVVMKWMELLDRCMQKEAVLDHEGNPTGEWKFQAREANAILENLAKYFGMFTKTSGEGKSVVLNLNFDGAPPKDISGDARVVN